MPPTDAQRRARDKWLSEKVETINLRVPKGSKVIIKTHAEKHGESTNAFRKFFWNPGFPSASQSSQNFGNTCKFQANPYNRGILI